MTPDDRQFNSIQPASQPDCHYGVVLVTASSQAEAESIARSLVTAKLAACVNLFPVQSIYSWDGELQQAAEWQLVIKTSLDRWAELESAILAAHSYEVPEIIALPIVSGSPAYLNWVATQTQPL